MGVEKRPFQQDRKIDRYFREDFFAALIDKGALEKRATPGGECERIALYQGMALPGELRQLLQLRAAYAGTVPTLGAWRILEGQEGPPDPSLGKLAEQLILADQEQVMGTGLIEYFAWCVRIGSDDKGDVYFATFDKRQPENCEVAFWDHEEQQMPFYIADSISSLAYGNHLLEVLSGEEAFDKTGLKKKARALAKRTNLPELYAELEAAGNFESAYEGHDVARYLYYRSMWIVRLLQKGPLVLEDMDALVSMVDAPWSGLDDAIEKGTLGQSPPAAFYWLWRCFFFGKTAELETTIDLCRQGINPLIDDMASLVEEIQAGRKRLGAIEDMHALREAFIALALDPAGDE